MEPGRYCGFRHISVDQRFFSKVHVTSGCWEWIANKTWGYGQFYVDRDRKSERAHRFAYEQMVGPIPEGMTIDHLCDNPGCVRPDHLKVATMRENVLRSTKAPPAQNARKTHCPQGHPYDEENTYYHRTATGVGRLCRACHRRHERARQSTPEFKARRRERYRLRKANS